MWTFRNPWADHTLYNYVHLLVRFFHGFIFPGMGPHMNVQIALGWTHLIQLYSLTCAVFPRFYLPWHGSSCEHSDTPGLNTPYTIIFTYLCSFSTVLSSLAWVLIWTFRYPWAEHTLYNYVHLLVRFFHGFYLPWHGSSYERSDSPGLNTPYTIKHTYLCGFSVLSSLAWVLMWTFRYPWAEHTSYNYIHLLVRFFYFIFPGMGPHMNIQVPLGWAHLIQLYSLTCAVFPRFYLPWHGSSYEHSGTPGLSTPYTIIFTYLCSFSTVLSSLAWVLMWTFRYP